jgi:hypothetical protein
MNLAWIAAVLRPLDIAPHPNFGSTFISEADAIASVISGEPWRLHQFGLYFTGEKSGEIDPTLEAVQKALLREHQEAGIRVLTSELVAGRPSDAARACALTLITCASAAELDDYDTCFSVLDHQLKWARRGRNADYRLIEAILTQQMSLRRRDTGQPYERESLQVVQLLTNFDVSRCSQFQLGPGVSWTSVTTLQQIVNAIYDAAISLLPIAQPSDAMRNTEIVPTWQELIRSRPVEQLLQIAAQERDTYERYISRLFVDRYQGSGTTIFQAESPDLFWPTFQLELLAHGAVYRARRELAQLRFLQADTQAHELDDVLRLFRHAAASRELEMTLRSLREAGPLEALSQDARRILSNRMRLTMLRSVELAVLAAAAELLTPAEGRLALDTVLLVLASGGPADLPGHQQIQPLRLETAWLAAAALAHAAGRSTDVAQALLTAIVGVDNADELLDRTFARAANNIRWSEVDTDAINAWQQWIENLDTLLPITRDAVASQLDVAQAFVVPENPDLQETARALNAILQGSQVERSSLTGSIEPIRRQLSEIRSAAASGRFSMGGILPADVAAGLILYGGQNELWPDLTEFLIDNRVPRDDRALALERLSRDAIELPESVQRRFSDASETLLHSDDTLFSGTMDPFPAALRFLGRFGCISDEEAFGLAAQLAGSSQLTKRREAGRTLAVWARRLTISWVATLAIQLSYDEDVQVDAHAAQVLARMTIAEGQFRELATQRLLELLSRDGLVIPLLALNQLRELQTPLPQTILTAIIDLEESHPSLDVRLAAATIVDRTT